MARIGGNQRSTPGRAAGARRLPLRLRDQRRPRHSTTLLVWTKRRSLGGVHIGRREAPRFRPNRQRGVCRGACSQSLAKHQRWPAGGWRLLLGDCDSAASLLDRRFRAGTITSCVGTDGTDGRRDLDHPAIAWPGGAVIASLPAHALPPTRVRRRRDCRSDGRSCLACGCERLADADDRADAFVPKRRSRAWGWGLLLRGDRTARRRRPAERRIGGSCNCSVAEHLSDTAACEGASW